MAKNVEGVGQAQAKTGEQATPLCRGKGFSETNSAMQSQTRSSHQGTGKHNRWEQLGSMSEHTANLHGHSPE